MDEGDQLGFWARVGVVIGFLASPPVVNAFLILVGILGTSAGITALAIHGAGEGGISAGILFVAAALAMGQLKRQ
ncbi:MAG: hypothetical protein BIFFINMI_00489 [Phycisphaerae bacterium]|nr:hypothetical protein [Phycisphaerae bacterium]